jgi:carboxyl-terminal processing protease
MTNRGTSSSAELLAAAIQDRNRGVVIGERTYGKGSVQDFITLEDGSKLELTIALYLTPSGRTIEGAGVTPDLVVKKSELNAKALQILGGLSELNNSSKKS